MFKQRYSSSGSTKTLSKSKFINRTIQQPHDASTESGKQGHTLRHQNKNKSCLIPRHLAQSTESHIVCSNESNKYKTNSRNRQSLKIQANAQNINPNIEKNTSKAHYDLNSKGNLIESKLTQPQNQYLSSVLGQPPLRFSHKPFLSVPDQQSHLKGNILSRLSDLTQNIQSLQLGQNNNNSSQLQRGKSNLQMNHKSATNTMMRQKVLEREVKQSFLYKSMQLTKSLQQMHRFCISVTQLKWICQQVNSLIKRYNQQIATYYQQFSTKYNKRSDLENILNQSQQLLKRFNQLEMMNSSIEPLFNFNLIANNMSVIKQKDDKQMGMAMGMVRRQGEMNSSGNDNQNSWSKLIENIQQNPSKNDDRVAKNATCNNLQTLPNDQNRNVTIRTFQATQTNSPSKNKTLNELIRLSQLRKTEFMSNYGSCDKENNPNKINQLPELQRQQQMNDNNKFVKKPRLSQMGLRQISPDRDPFDSIHLPHFNTKPQPTPSQTNQPPHLQIQHYYSSQITRLTNLIQHTNQQNLQIHRKMDAKNQQLMKENEQLKVKMLKQEESFSLFEQAIYKIVQTALNELVNCCAKVNEGLVDGRRGSLSMNNLVGYSHHQSKASSQPMIMITNRSFFQLVHCLQQVFKLNRLPTYNNKTIFSFSGTQHKLTQHHNISSSQNTQLDKKLQQQKDLLVQEIDELRMLKAELEREIIRQEQNLKQQQVRVRNEASVAIRENYNQLTQVIFAQAFTIEDMLQMEPEEDEQ